MSLDVRRLILEVQRHRLDLLETREMFDEGFRQLTTEYRAITANGMPLSKVRVKLAIAYRTGTYVSIIAAIDEPAAWAQLTREHVLKG